MSAQWLRELRTGPRRAAVRSGAALELAGVGKRYDGMAVLSDFSLAIDPGSFVAVIGRSGCGKSTLLRLIAGLESPDAGEVRVDGKVLRRLNGESRIMFQDSRLLPWRRVVDNVALGLPAGLAQAQAVLEQVGLGGRAHAWPRVLSGGQRQRVALARALVHDPRLLLLDEPLGALDALTRIEMHRLIEELWLARGFTALLVTHDVAEAVTLADRVILLESGQPALDIAIDLPRPRSRGSVEFGRLQERILQRLLDPGDVTRRDAGTGVAVQERRKPAWKVS